MISVNQTIHSFTNGDCMRACVASVFEMKIEDVPNFMKDGEDYFAEHLQRFCSKLGLYALDMEFHET